jgi:pimeloyl-ACP methyl ester carboxylesterase
MSPTFRITLIGVLFATLAGCAAASAYLPETQPLDPGRLPSPDISVNIPGLGPCTDAPDRRLHLNSNQPVTVLVHGCKGSAGRFRSLAQLYAFHGQQAVCFSYNDRDSLVRSSHELIAALDELSGQMRNRHLTVMGHSMGGLVARKALERDRADSWRRHDVDLNLLTISAPFAGIEIAEPCGYASIQWLSLGTTVGICRLITGDNWYEITSSSDFIRHPGPLLATVQKYLKIVTDERDTCRRRDESGRCVASDYVFSLPEQYQKVVDGYTQLTNVEVDAGHVEIVGDKHMVPRKLLAILQEQGMLAPTPPERRVALERLLAELY